MVGMGDQAFEKTNSRQPPGNSASASNLSGKDGAAARRSGSDGWNAGGQGALARILQKKAFIALTRADRLWLLREKEAPR